MPWASIYLLISEYKLQDKRERRPIFLSKGSNLHQEMDLMKIYMMNYSVVSILWKLRIIEGCALFEWTPNQGLRESIEILRSDVLLGTVSLIETPTIDTWAYLLYWYYGMLVTHLFLIRVWNFCQCNIHLDILLVSIRFVPTHHSPKLFIQCLYSSIHFSFHMGFFFLFYILLHYPFVFDLCICIVLSPVSKNDLVMNLYEHYVSNNNSSA